MGSRTLLAWVVTLAIGSAGCLPTVDVSEEREKVENEILLSPSSRARGPVGKSSSPHAGIADAQSASGSEPESADDAPASPSTLEISYDGAELSIAVHRGADAQRGEQLLGGDEVAARIDTADFLPGNLLVFTASFKNLTADVTYRDIVFAQSSQSSDEVSSTVPELHPCDTWEPLTYSGPYEFRVHHEGRPFQYFVDVRADEQDDSLCGVDVDVESSPGEISIAPGSARNLASFVRLRNASDERQRVIIRQQIRGVGGSLDGGVELLPAMADTESGGTFASTEDLATVYYQQVRGITAGKYVIETTAEVVGANVSHSSSVEVTVATPRAIAVNLVGPMVSPAALEPGVVTEVRIMSRPRSGDAPGLVSVVAHADGIDAPLNDDGVAGDRWPGDGLYSGTVDIDAGVVGSDGCFELAVTATDSAGPVTSPTTPLCVTELPQNVAPSDMTDALADAATGSESVANEILLRTRPGTSDAVLESLANSAGAEIVGRIPATGLVQLRFDESFGTIESIEAAVEDLRSMDGVEGASQNFILHATAVAPNDPGFTANDSCSNSLPLRAVRADEAWNLVAGARVSGAGTPIKVAVLDTGIDTAHVDFRGRLAESSGATVWRNFRPGETGDPRDTHGHGTHVAGLIGAGANDGTGVAGVAWTSELMIARVFDDDLRAEMSIVLDAIEWADTEGAEVINISGVATGADEDPLCGAIADAVSDGITVVAPSGNLADGGALGGELPWPARCPGTLVVGGLSESPSAEEVSLDFSSEAYVPTEAGNPLPDARKIHIAAPSECIPSTLPSSGVFCSENAQNQAACERPGGGWGTMTGTSMAAALVSGTVALMLSRDDSLTPLEIQTLLRTTGTPFEHESKTYRALNVFDALFNGSFEAPLSRSVNNGWWADNLDATRGTPSRREGDWGADISPVDGVAMGAISTGPDNVGATLRMGELSQRFPVQEAVFSRAPSGATGPCGTGYRAEGYFTISFDYNFVTEEYCEWVGTRYDDLLRISIEGDGVCLRRPDGTEFEFYDAYGNRQPEGTVAFESVNTSFPECLLDPTDAEYASRTILGVNYDGGDDTVGHTGWRSVAVRVYVRDDALDADYTLRVEDLGDEIFDSEVLVDDIRFDE